VKSLTPNPLHAMEKGIEQSRRDTSQLKLKDIVQMQLDDLYRGRTLVFGHRGASAYAPMNTLPAFELAAQQGADGIELDVWLCGDKRSLVILHDSTVDHTTDGSGVVYQKTLDELRELDASNRFEQYKGVQIPTLDEVFETVGNRLFINVEIKYDPGMIPGVEAAVAEKLRRFRLEKHVIVSSFSAGVLKNFRQLMPDVAIGFLYAEETPASEWELIKDVPHQARHPHHTMIDADHMAEIKPSGLRVNTWTVNDPMRALELRDLGIDAVITDKPDVMVMALGR
jgi:glycerophosphoryl diester phosphodiesterase